MTKRRGLKAVAASGTLAALLGACTASNAGVGMGGDNGQAGSGGFAGGTSSGGTGPLIGQEGGLAASDSGIIDPSQPDAELTADAACAAEVSQGEAIPVNIYVMLDRSGSMGSSKWSAATNGVADFVADPKAAGLKVALSYFPTDEDSCSPETYTAPTIDLGQLTADPAPTDLQEDLLVQSLTTTSTTGSTPMYPAFVGALGFSTALAKQNPSEKYLTILVTDGSPTGCDSSTNNVDKIKDIAASGASDTPPVLTFTIGLEGSKEPELIQIAQAGGGEAFFLGGSQNVQQDLIDKFNEIAETTLKCDLQIPEAGPGQTVDTGLVNVRYFKNGSLEETLFKVKDKTECAPGGWYYDNDDDPTRITLCPDTCDDVTSDASSQVEILVGCETIQPVPK